MTSLANPKRIINFLKNRYAPRGAHQSFTQSGEDLIIAEALKNLGVAKPTYIDIGAHHPIFENNTYKLYRQGGHGIIIEPNTALCKLAKNKRSRDNVLNIGVGDSDQEADFFQFSQSTRSTFSADQADAWSKTSGQVASKINLPILTLDSIIKKYWSKSSIDLLSIDAEGYDRQILTSFSWALRPKIICVESDLSDLLAEKDYFVYAKTKANTIFMDRLITSKN